MTLKMFKNVLLMLTIFNIIEKEGFKIRGAFTDNIGYSSIWHENVCIFDRHVSKRC